MTLKKERRLLAKRLKAFGLKLPMRQRLAREYVRLGSANLALEKLGASLVREVWCECCGTTGATYSLEGKTVDTRFGEFDP